MLGWRSEKLQQDEQEEFREEILVCHINGDNQKTIAKKTGYSQSAISRELKKGEDAGPIILSWRKESSTLTQKAELEDSRETMLPGR